MILKFMLSEYWVANSDVSYCSQMTGTATTSK